MIAILSAQAVGPNYLAFWISRGACRARIATVGAYWRELTNMEALKFLKEEANRKRKVLQETAASKVSKMYF